MKNTNNTDERLSVISEHINGDPFVVQSKDGTLYRVAITNDDDPLDPRVDMDNLGKLLCAHRRYRLGDDYLEREEYEELKGKLRRNDPDYAILPVYLLDHGVRHISTHDFGDPWDSGFVGFIFCTAADYEKWTCKEWDKEDALRRLEDEISDYEHYLAGDFLAVRTAKWQPNKINALPDPTNPDQWDFMNGEFFGMLYGEKNLHYAIADAVKSLDYTIVGEDNTDAVQRAQRAISQDVIEVPCPCCKDDNKITLYPVNGKMEGYCNNCGTFLRTNKGKIVG